MELLCQRISLKNLLYVVNCLSETLKHFHVPQWYIERAYFSKCLSVLNIFILQLSSINREIFILFYFNQFYILVFNRLQKKTHTIISISAGKAFDKIQHLFLIKNSASQKQKGLFSNLIKGIFKNLQLTIILNGARVNVFPVRLRTRQGFLLLPRLFNIVCRPWPVHQAKEKEGKANVEGVRAGGHINWEGEMKLFVDEMTL